MYTTALRKVGGSTMVAVPRAFLDQLEMKVGSTVEVEVSHGCIMVKPKARKSYKLEDLLAKCDSSAEISEDDREWFDSGVFGNEVI